MGKLDNRAGRFQNHLLGHVMDGTALSPAHRRPVREHSTGLMYVGSWKARSDNERKEVGLRGWKNGHSGPQGKQVCYFISSWLFSLVFWARSKGQGSALKINLLGLLNQAEAGQFWPSKLRKSHQEDEVELVLKTACLAGGANPRITELCSQHQCSNINLALSHFAL